MATYRKVPDTVNSSERTMLITAVGVGDKIDLYDVLGRPANGIQFVMAAITDVVGYRLNSLIRTIRKNEENTSQDQNWSTSAAFPVWTSTGALTLQTVDGLRVSSIEIASLTLGVGTTISIIVW